MGGLGRVLGVVWGGLWGVPGGSLLRWAVDFLGIYVVYGDCQSLSKTVIIHLYIR